MGKNLVNKNLKRSTFENTDDDQQDFRDVRYKCAQGKKVEKKKKKKNFFHRQFFMEEDL
jgi:hypothetical protein